jgi:hypothetical protein
MLRISRISRMSRISMMSSMRHLQVGGRHLVMAPEVLLLAALVQAGFELLAQALRVLAALVLGHPEQHGGGVGG